MSEKLPQRDPLHSLQELTSARIALGRVGASVPTAALLDFGLDHALARDAIYTSLDVAGLEQQLREAGLQCLTAASSAPDRSSYLRRPDLGRSLNAKAEDTLRRNDAVPERLLSVVIADGLSALAPNTHAVPLLLELQSRLSDWTFDAVVLATQARVALGDAIAGLRGAEAVLVLIGERPGLRSPDSLGAYLTYRPRVGCMDSERNCVSNIRTQGLSYTEAAVRIASLLRGARMLGATGVALKDESGGLNLP